jgi:hypothetical protein
VKSNSFILAGLFFIVAGNVNLLQESVAFYHGICSIAQNYLMFRYFYEVTLPSF